MTETHQMEWEIFGAVYGLGFYLFLAHLDLDRCASLVTCLSFEALGNEISKANGVFWEMESEISNLT